MPRCSCIVRQFFILGISLFFQFRFIQLTAADCLYDNKIYKEAQQVPTFEPCLNCTCTKSILLCYLRVCPNLPNPPPVGCILLHRYHHCCPELICSTTESAQISNNALLLEGRSDALTIEDQQQSISDLKINKNACIVNGTIYSPGSAMDSSTSCRYCYCLGGKETCVKPKCLLPIDGCRPVYDKNDKHTCCPIRYDCNKLEISSTAAPSTSTTTIAPKDETVAVREQLEGGCLVNSTYYKEGGKVLGIGYSACDNCYCLRGILRCEPLSCAPALLGCLPVVREGECCAASYNCNGGMIEIQAEPNYGHFPIISKEYAKLHKHNNNIPKATNDIIPNKKLASAQNKNPFYVIAQSWKNQRSPVTFGTTRQFNLVQVLSTPTLEDVEKTTFRPFEEDETTRTTLKIDGRNNEIGDDTTTETFSSTLPTTTVTEITSEETTTDLTSTITTEEANNFNSVVNIINSTDCVDGTTSEMAPETTTNFIPVDANEINAKLATVVDLKNLQEYLMTTTENQDDFSTSTETSAGDDVTEINLEKEMKMISTTKSSNLKPQLTLRDILNVSVSSKNKEQQEDYDYDYNEPSLPPSLPNLRIIPFVAADAVVDNNKKLSKEELEGKNPFINYSKFSPPAETEGGFVPKDPQTLDDLNFYQDNKEIPSITTEVPPNKINCFIDGQQTPHGLPVPSANINNSPCLLCLCFYGDVVCQTKPSCSSTLSYKNDKEKLEDITTDPFRDVIRTEPAPVLATTINNNINNNYKIKEDNEGFSLDKVLELLFSTTPTNTSTHLDQYLTTTTPPPPPPPLNNHAEQENNDVEAYDNNKRHSENNQPHAILKLAGCNIYGRMYRVGRIISELSNPCLECKCTEIGVQCRALKC